MLDKYIKINDKQIVAGQTSSGIWYCKELPANTVLELKHLIGEINDVLNKFNIEHSKEPVISKDKKIKGME
jgi:histidinol phosphatase-like enzyme